MGEQREKLRTPKNDFFDKITEIVNEKGCISDCKIQQLVGMLRGKPENLKTPTRMKSCTSNIKHDLTSTKAKRETIKERKGDTKLEELTRKMSDYLLKEKGGIIDQDIQDVAKHIKSLSVMTGSKNLPDDIFFDAIKQRTGTKVHLENDLKSTSATRILPSKEINYKTQKKSCQIVSCTNLLNDKIDTKVTSPLNKNKGKTKNQNSTASNKKNSTAANGKPNANNINSPKIQTKAMAPEKFKMKLHNIKEDRIYSPSEMPINKKENHDCRIHTENVKQNFEISQKIIKQDYSNEIGSTKNKWKTNTERITVMMTDNFINSLIFIERQDDKNDTHDLIQLYSKITDVILSEMQNINKGDIQEISHLLEKCSDKPKITDQKIFNTLTPDIPKWALRGFLEKGTNSIIKMVEPLLNEMVKYIINEKGKFQQSDIINFCTELIRKLPKHTEGTNNKNKQIHTAQLQQSKIKQSKGDSVVNEHKVVTEGTKPQNQESKIFREPMNQIERVNKFINKPVAQNLITKNDVTTTNPSCCINVAIENGIRSLVFIKKLSEQLLTDLDKKNTNIINKTIQKKIIRNNISLDKNSSLVTKPKNKVANERILKDNIHKIKGATSDLSNINPIHEITKGEREDAIMKTKNLSRNKKALRISTAYPPMCADSEPKELDNCKIINTTIRSPERNVRRCSTAATFESKTNENETICKQYKATENTNKKSTPEKSNSSNLKRNEFTMQAKIKDKKMNEPMNSTMTRNQKSTAVKPLKTMVEEKRIERGLQNKNTHSEQLKLQNSHTDENKTIKSSESNINIDSNSSFKISLKTCRTYSVFKPLLKHKPSEQNQGKPTTSKNEASPQLQCSTKNNNKVEKKSFLKSKDGLRSTNPKLVSRIPVRLQQ